MNNPFFMRRRQSVGDLERIFESFSDRNRSAAEAVAQSLAFEQFRDDIGRALAGANVEYGQNVGMIQRGSGESFLLEAAHAIGVERKRRWQDFNGNVASKAGISGPIHLAHSASA